MALISFRSFYFGGFLISFYINFFPQFQFHFFFNILQFLFFSSSFCQLIRYHLPLFVIWIKVRLHHSLHTIHNHSHRLNHRMTRKEINSSMKMTWKNVDLRSYWNSCRFSSFSSLFLISFFFALFMSIIELFSVRGEHNFLRALSSTWQLVFIAIVLQEM